VVKEILLPTSPEVVWESLTTPEQLSLWLGGRVEIEARPGGLLRLESGGGDVRFGVIEAARPAEYLAFRWRAIRAGPGGRVPGRGTRVEFVLEPKESGTFLRVVETMLPGASLASGLLAVGAGR
jgi:uncharacterized protein YndB with AHSA1/START domain